MNDHLSRKGPAGRDVAPPRRRPTIRDVAGLAGVSHQTVSRYLRHSGGLRPATVAAIESAIDELGYRPDLTARSMRTRRSDTLAVVIAGLPRGGMYQRELTAACAVAHHAGYRTEIVLAEGDAKDRRDRILALLEDGQVDGVLAMAPVALDGGRADHRIVATADLDDDMRNTGALADGTTAGLIVEHLSDLGHRHFLHIAGDMSYASARNRASAYEAAIDLLGVKSHGVVGYSWTAETGYQAVIQLPEDSPVTAVVAANDSTATGAVRAAFERGWSVPERLSVFGWDNQVLGRYAVPTLSTVEVDRERRGRYVMEQLIAAIRHEPQPEPPKSPLNTLIFRESTAPPGSPAAHQPVAEIADHQSQHASDCQHASD